MCVCVYVCVLGSANGGGCVVDGGVLRQLFEYYYYIPTL